MDGVGLIIKNQEYKEVKSSRLVIDTPQEFSVAAQTSVPPITTIYLPKNETIQEPNEMENTPVIPKIFQIQKVVRSSIHRELLALNFTICPMKANPTSRSTTEMNVIKLYVNTKKTNMLTKIRVHIAPAVTEIQTCQNG